MESWDEDHTHIGGPDGLEEAAAMGLVVHCLAAPWWRPQMQLVGRAKGLVAAAASGLLARRPKLMVVGFLGLPFERSRRRRSR